MEDIIHLLPDSVANQIAAGEVVQRPSSIVKEMVENSIDAGAENIQVLVVDGGKTSVQVVDDGKGMSETDARLSFERHATSKILKAADLFNLTTMGFRGEALASIAAVAQVDLTTRRKEDELGTFIQIAGSKIERQEPVSCAVGSNFAVKNLFFNVPARRKFLKSNQTELTNVIQDFERIVLVHPDISFTLYNNGAEMYRLPKASVRQRILDVFGKKINSDLLPIEVETSLVSVSGYVAKPESSKKKGAKQFFFVNGRYMRHAYFHSAVMRAYENLIPAGEHVSYFIYFSVDPSTIDVNVHPTKTEIKFDNEQPIWQVLSATIKETLGKSSNVPMIDFDVEGKPNIPTFGTGPSYNGVYSQPKPVSSYNPFKQGNEKGYVDTSNWEALYKGVAGTSNRIDSELMPSGNNSQDYDLGLVPSNGKNMPGVQGFGGGVPSFDEEGMCPSSNNWKDNSFGLEASDGNVPDELFVSADNDSRGGLGDSGDMSASENLFASDGISGPMDESAIGLFSSSERESGFFDTSLPKFQFRGRYIVAPSKHGLLVVDQHRAHVRVLYEENVKTMMQKGRPAQKILFPEIVQFTKGEAAVLESVMDDVIKLGFDLSNLGGESYSVNGVPSGIDSMNADELLHELVIAAMDNTNGVAQSVQESMALVMAKSLAIVYGQVLSQVEMAELLKNLFNLSTPARTPDGKIVYSVIDNKELERLF